jgi:hypothetical protein
LEMKFVVPFNEEEEEDEEWIEERRSTEFDGVLFVYVVDE